MHGKSSMTAWLNLVWSICFLRKGPQDMPASRLLFALVLGASVCNDWLLSMLLSNGTADPAIIAWGIAASVVITVMFTYLVIVLRQLPGRIWQTLTTFWSVQLFLSLLLIYPLILLLNVIGKPATDSVMMTMLSILILLILNCRNILALVVVAHIYRCALNVNFLGGLLATVCLLSLHHLAAIIL